MLGVLFLTGCSTESSLSFSKTSKGSLNKDIQAFFIDMKQQNGVHLYFDNHNETILVYLNGANVVKGENALHFTEFEVEEEVDTLNLLYKSDETSDYSNSSLEHELFYEIKLDKAYSEVNLFKNGSQETFGTISGNK